MSQYKGIVGQKVVSYTTDPDNPIQGQVWYNATANTLKLEGQTTSGSWSSGGNLNQARTNLSGAGIQTAALGFGGQVSSTIYTLTEQYNGSSWTEVSDLNTGRYALGGNGTYTSALAYGGTPPTTGKTESWVGS